VVQLPEKIQTTHTPEIVIVDLKNVKERSRNSFLSASLLSGIESALEKNQQVLLFHNRRGSAGLILCEHCGWQALCPDCHMPLVLHADDHVIRCHLCGHEEPVKPFCPVCKHADIAFKGIGTKRIEAEIVKLFPKAKVRRFDGDNKTDERFHLHYDTIRANEVNIIVGTQQLAKGLNLPHLAVVGIVQADTGLLLPDYSAPERTFQLISQVVGRAGRQDHPTKVVIQTYQPENELIQQAAHEDYPGFYEQAIRTRKRENLPPFTHTLQLIVTYKTERSAVTAARSVARELKKQPRLTVLGPTPAFYERLRGAYRWQIVVKSPDRALLQAIAADMPAHWHAELDPKSFLG
jgi:primosomal protein N' (replication factor Y)